MIWRDGESSGATILCILLLFLPSLVSPSLSCSVFFAGTHRGLRGGVVWVRANGTVTVSYLPDGVTGPETNPLGDRTVLSLSFGKLLLGAETLVALY